MDAIHTAQRIVAIEAARAYVAEIGPIDMTNSRVLCGHLMAAETLLMEIVSAYEGEQSRETN